MDQTEIEDENSIAVKSILPENTLIETNEEGLTYEEEKKEDVQNEEEKKEDDQNEEEKKDDDQNEEKKKEDVEYSPPEKRMKNDVTKRIFMFSY